MSEVLDTIRIMIEQLIHIFGYPGIFFIMAIENLFPPIPSELVMPFSGFLVSDDQLSLIGILVSGTTGAVFGAGLIYYLGTMVDETQARQWFDRYGRYMLLSTHDFDRAMAAFDRYGKWIILFARLIPAVRSLISFPAGMKRMNFLQFVILTFIGSLGWNLILASAGVFLGSNWEVVLKWVDRYEFVIIILLCMVSFYLIFRKVRQKSPG